MNDSELCKMFGTTVEQVESDCEKYESGDFSGWELGKPIDGRPKAPMNTADDKTYTVSSREVIYKGACNDVDLNPYRDAVLWYVGNDRDEALRIARKYAADVRDTGKVEVCKNGISRNVFEVCETQLDEDGDIVDEDTIEIVDPLDACSAKTGMPIDLTDTASTVDGRWVMSDDLPWIARWHACRQVYKIDRTVSDTLVEQELDGDLPVELIHRMPYPIIYVDAHVPVSCQTTKRWADGFFAYLDRDLMGELDITFVYLMDDGTRSRMSLVIEDGATLETCLAHIADVDDVLDELTGGSMSRNKITDPEELACLRYCATASLNLLLFVLSAENGAETVYTPPKQSKGQKVGRRTNTETVRMLGAKIGSAIGAARRVGYAPHEGTGERTVAPHVRRAHWQSFWTGKRKGREDGKFGDELVVKWIPPIPVNQGAGEVTETVHLNSTEAGE